MTDALTGDAARPQPAAVNLAGINPLHAEQESLEHLLGTTIAETATGVTGVHHLGGVVARSLDRARRQVLGTSSAPGVTVSDDDGVTTVDLDIVVEYPHPIDDVIDETRVQVTHASRQIVPTAVVVNITVTGVHGPFDQDPAVLDAIDRAGETAHDVADQAKVKAGELQDKAGDLKDRAADKADELRGTAADRVDELGDRATELKASADDKVAELREQADQKVGELKRQSDEKVQEIDAMADEKLDELDKKADEKLHELDVEAEATGKDRA